MRSKCPRLFFSFRCRPGEDYKETRRADGAKDISVVAMGANEELQSEGGRYFPSRSALSSQCNSASSTTSNRSFQSAEKQLHHIYQGKDLFQRSKYRM